MENPFNVGEIVTLVSSSRYAKPFTFFPVTKVTKTTVTLSNGKTYQANNGKERGTGLNYPDRIVKKTSRHEEVNRELEEQRLVQDLRRTLSQQIEKTFDLTKLQQIAAILAE